MSRLKIFTFLICVFYFWFFIFGFSVSAQKTYPQLDITGYKKWEYKKAEVDPSRNYYTGLTYLGGYYPTYTGGPWQERLQLKILGQLSKDLSVSYDLEQQPELPEKYDVKVKYLNNELTFGYFNANFSGNEFASSSRYLNGVMFSAKNGWYDLVTVPSARVQSQTQTITAQKGNNTRGTYSLGHGSILEGSEAIYLNNVLLKRNVDYTIDYFEGKVTFTKIITPNDEFKYNYEYTNILDLFFPTLSKRDFFGFQSRFTINPDQFGRPLPQPVPLTEPTRETFPTIISGTEEIEIGEDESTGNYQLKFTPVVKFSEFLTFRGKELKRNEDYLIHYEEGAIKLLTDEFPTTSEVLIVEYQFYQTSQEGETLYGIGSRGPYKLTHPFIILFSEEIIVNQKLLIRDLDYQIDYDLGQITFARELGSASIIQTNYRYQIRVIPQLPPPKFPKEITLGGTYLKESAKKSVSSPTATVIESTTGQNIIDKGNIFYVSKYPLSSTAEASITVNGVAISYEVDYVIPTIEVDAATSYTRVIPDTKLAYINDRTDRSDGLTTGTIKFRKTINSTDEVSIVYTYKKSTVGKFSGSGNGTRGPFYLRGLYNNIVPGTEVVQVWEQGSSTITTYTRNSSFEANAGDTGYAINYTADNPSIYFNKELETTKNFQTIFQYVPPTGYEGGNIAHEITGFDGSFKIGEILKVEGSTATSKIDQSYTSTPTTETKTGNNTKNYTLSAPYDIIEGSEKVYVNGYLRNKDIDYYISYAKPGTLTFYYITPTTADAMAIEYEYKAPLGVVGETTKKEDKAYKVHLSSKLLADKIIISATQKEIGYDFTPLAGTSIGLGSKYRDFDFAFKPEFHTLSLSYAYKQNDNPLTSYRDKFLKTYDHSTSGSISPFGLFKVDLGYRKYSTLDDLLPSATIHSSDSLQENLWANLTPGEWKKGQLLFLQKYEFKKTLSEADFVDKISPEKNRTDYWHGTFNLNLTDRLKANYDWQISEPFTAKMRTLSTEAGVTTSETEYSHSRSFDASYGTTLDLTLGKLQKWSASATFVNHEEKTFRSNFEISDKISATKNETYHIDLVPFKIFTTAFDHYREEKLTVTSGAENPKSVKTSAATKLTPHSSTTVSWSGSESNGVQESGAKTRGKSNSSGLEYTPISWERLKVVSKFSKSDGSQTAPSGSWEVTTDTNTFNQDYSLNLIPHSKIPITLGFSQEDYKNKNDSSASPVDTLTRNKTTKIDLSFTPLAFITFGGNYNLKYTENLKTGENRPKAVTEGKITYQWGKIGTIVYSLQQEKNQGEIQAGSVADYDFKKLTQNISLNLSFPQDNPILSSINFLTNWKQVGYENYKNRSDDFKASLLTFEGTLNF